VERAAFLLRPIHERLLAAVKGSAKLFADETTAPVLDPGRGRTKLGQLWAYARDDRPRGGTDPPGIACKAERPITHLITVTVYTEANGRQRPLAVAALEDRIVGWPDSRMPGEHVLWSESDPVCQLSNLIPTMKRTAPSAARTTASRTRLAR
jgi:transposase IS66 family protein